MTKSKAPMSECVTIGYGARGILCEKVSLFAFTLWYNLWVSWISLFNLTETNDPLVSVIPHIIRSCHDFLASK